MTLLFDEDYEYLKECRLEYEENETQRFLIIKNFPLPEGLYVSNGNPILATDVLVVIPENYNTSGIDMIWTNPHLLRTDGKPIPAASMPQPDPGAVDPRFHNGKEYYRWSRHWNKPETAWKPKKDKVGTILDRIEWIFHNPDADQK